MSLHNVTKNKDFAGKMYLLETFGGMTNNYRIYGTVFLLVEVLIVTMGVRFVQLFAPVNQCCLGRPNLGKSSY
jgi:hypothetical protein